MKRNWKPTFPAPRHRSLLLHAPFLRFIRAQNQIPGPWGQDCAVASDAVPSSSCNVWAPSVCLYLHAIKAELRSDGSHLHNEEPIPSTEGHGADFLSP